MFRTSLLAAGVILMVGGISAADGVDVQRHVRIKKPRTYVYRAPYPLLVPDCFERYDAEILLCAPRVRLYPPYDPRVVVQMRTLLVRARPPYPQGYTYSR
jgi:hypothetical protein